MSAAEIIVKIHGDKAIVRKVVRDEQGQFVAKFGLLNTTGEWWQVADGERYPGVCKLDVWTVRTD